MFVTLNSTIGSLTMQGLGKHVLLDLYGCPEELLNDQELMEQHLRDAAVKAKATIYESVFHAFSPHGISGVVVVGESHFAIHTWPEKGFAAVDIFTCSDKMQEQEAINFLKEALQAKRLSLKEVDRGTE